MIIMKHKFTTNLDDELIARLKIQAVKEHRSAANIISEVVAKYLDQQSSRD